MQVALAKPPPSKKGFFSKVSDDLLPPISLTKDTLNWPLIHDPKGEVNLENWHLSSSDEASPLYRSSARITFSKNLQNTTFASQMSRLENKGSDAPQRWKLNNKGQLIDSEARGWGLADEIGGLKLSDVDESEDVHGVVQTPLKSTLATAVAQLGEGSPLESSSTSAGSSPQAAEHQIALSHSRGSSADTSVSSMHGSSGNMLQAHAQMATITTTEAKERPRSLNGGGFSNADGRRLQQTGESSDVQWMQNQQYADNASAGSELSYPSLLNHIHRPQPQLHPNLYDIRSGLQQSSAPRSAAREDGLGDFGNPRDFGSSMPGMAGYLPVQTGGSISGAAYRQPPRAYPQQGLIGSPNIGYQGSHHTSHLSLGNTQQLYDMMLPGVRDSLSVMARVQQQPNLFRPTHHHSASDPSALRDPAALALLANNMQTFGPSLQAGPLPFYGNQFFGAQDPYARSEVTAAQLMAARIQQFGGAYATAQSNLGVDNTVPVIPSPTSHSGPSTNNRKVNLYKTELCRSWEEKGTCRYGAKCQFAHGEEELRKVSRHPKYKTEICRTFWVSGSCPYGKRCCFIHTEVPVAGNPNPGNSNASDSATSQSNADGRSRSLSTNSDPNDTSVSLLARISAKRNQETNNSVPDSTPTKNVSFARPAVGSLRVDTSSLDGPSLKQNKSAYPSFASNGILLPATDHVSTKSPGPVTAGPDLGRHNASRMEIVGFSNQRAAKAINSSDLDLNFKQTSVLSPIDNLTTPRASGHHVRGSSSGTATNWISRNGPMSAFPHGSSQSSAPWSSTDLAIGSTRLSEKAWA
ncbi:hypothetical protein JOM56_005916 [Amanita muscaria]